MIDSFLVIPSIVYGSDPEIVMPVWFFQEYLTSKEWIVFFFGTFVSGTI